MKIKHVMKDGVIRTDISGHVVRRSDAKTVYNMVEELNKRRANNEI